MTYHYQDVETPFSYRHCCWFCGEPAASSFSFPQHQHVVLNCIHPALTLPCCNECLTPANKSIKASIWQVHIEVKQYLIKTYQKDLAIGINWTKEELANSEFEQGNFSGFQQSAWMMHEIAKSRVNFESWRLVVAGINIDECRWQVDEVFLFDGVVYPSIIIATEHFAKTFNLHKDFFERVLLKIGKENFSQAVRFCRLLVNATPNERMEAYNSL